MLWKGVTENLEMLKNAVLVFAGTLLVSNQPQAKASMPSDFAYQHPEHCVTDKSRYRKLTKSFRPGFRIVNGCLHKSTTDKKNLMIYTKSSKQLLVDWFDESLIPGMAKSHGVSTEYYKKMMRFKYVAKKRGIRLAYSKNKLSYNLEVTSIRPGTYPIYAIPIHLGKGKQRKPSATTMTIIAD